MNCIKCQINHLHIYCIYCSNVFCSNSNLISHITNNHQSELISHLYSTYKMVNMQPKTLNDYFHYKNFRVVKYKSDIKSISSINKVKHKTDNKDYYMIVSNDINIIYKDIFVENEQIKSYLLKFHGYSKTNNNIYSIYDFCEGRLLSDHIKSQTIGEIEIQSIMINLIKTVSTFHSNGFSLSGLEIESIVYSKNLKLFNYNDKIISKHHDNYERCKEIDIWSIGLILLRILFPDHTLIHQLNKNNLSLLTQIEYFESVIETIDFDLSKYPQNINCFLKNSITNYKYITIKALEDNEWINEEYPIQRRPLTTRVNNEKLFSQEDLPSYNDFCKIMKDRNEEKQIEKIKNIQLTERVTEGNTIKPIKRISQNIKKQKESILMNVRMKPSQANITKTNIDLINIKSNLYMSTEPELQIPNKKTLINKVTNYDRSKIKKLNLGELTVDNRKDTTDHYSTDEFTNMIKLKDNTYNDSLFTLERATSPNTDIIFSRKNKRNQNNGLISSVLSFFTSN